MKASIAGELLLLIGLAALAYFLYVQQGQLVELELELDRMRGAVGAVFPPVPVADSGNSASAEVAAEPKPKPKRRASGA